MAESYNSHALVPARKLAGGKSTGRRGAYTLVEMMVSLVVFSIVMLALVSGTIALMRAFSAVDQYSTANADQTRVLDFISRDVRNSLSSQSPQVLITSNPTALQVTVPEYYDSSGNAITPTVSGTSVTYGSTPIVVTYTLNGTTLTRTEGSNTPVILSSSIASFVPVVDTAYDSTGHTVKITLTFSSTFQTAWSTVGTTLSTRVAMRP